MVAIQIPRPAEEWAPVPETSPDAPASSRRPAPPATCPIAPPVSVVDGWPRSWPSWSSSSSRSRRSPSPASRRRSCRPGRSALDHRRPGPRRSRATEYVVRRGDTLWTIAAESPPTTIHGRSSTRSARRTAAPSSRSAAPRPRRRLIRLGRQLLELVRQGLVAPCAAGSRRSRATPGRSGPGEPPLEVLDLGRVARRRCGHAARRPPARPRRRPATWPRRAPAARGRGHRRRAGGSTPASGRRRRRPPAAPATGCSPRRRWPMDVSATVPVDVVDARLALLPLPLHQRVLVVR